MSTLERCADALLQQKVVQASNYERLESRLMELERAKRSLFFGLKEAITDVERRRQDLGELREESGRLRQQLQQSAVRFGALSAFMGAEQQKCAALQDRLDGASAAWTGCPARAALVARALQERRAFSREFAAVLAALQRAAALCHAMERAEAARTASTRRLNAQCANAAAATAALQRRLRSAERRQIDTRDAAARRVDAAKALFRLAQEMERRQLLAAAQSLAARLAQSGRSAVCREASQSALAIAHIAAERRARVWGSAWFAQIRAAHWHSAGAAVRQKAEAVAHALDAQIRAAAARRERTEAAKKTSLHITWALTARRDAARRELAHKRQQMTSRRRLWAALRAWRTRRHVWRAQCTTERMDVSRRVSAARAKRAATRFIAREEEAREGIAAEESLTRSALLTAKKEREREKEMEKEREREKERGVRHVLVGGRTEKKRPRSIAAPRRTYPSAGDDAFPRWAGGAKLPLSAVAKTTRPGSPPPRRPPPFTSALCTAVARRTVAKGKGVPPNRTRPAVAVSRDDWAAKSEDIFADVFSL